ncbi:MAG: hypothetical protein GY930_13410 [bacterium]|nr:hypothetical protein [bacterium]
MNASLNEQVASYSGIGRPRLKGQQLPNPKTWTTNKKAKWKRIKLNLYGKQMTLLVLTRKCLWYTATGQRLVHVLVTRDPKGNFEDRAFFSTDPNANPAQLLGRLAKPWLIEVSFRDAKQLFGLTDPQNGISRGHKEPGRPKPGPQLRGSHGQKAVQRTVPFIWTVYGLVVIWYLRTNRWEQDANTHRDRAPWYRSKVAPSCEGMLGSLRIGVVSRGLLARPLPNRTLAETRKTLLRLGMAA